MRFSHIRFARAAVAAALASSVLLGGSGCEQKPVPLSLSPSMSSKSSHPDDFTPPPQPVAPTAIDPAVINAKGQAKETWEAVYAYGTKIGWGHTVQRDFVRNGEKLVQIDTENHLNVDREGQRTAIAIQTKSIEKPDGELLEFHTTMNTGPSRTEMRGAVHGDKLVVETVTEGKVTTQPLPWIPGTLGFNAAEQSLAGSPMLPGQRRTLRALGVITNTLVTIELVAGEYEPALLLDHTRDLLRIDSTITLPVGASDENPPVIHTTLWTDREGQIWKTAVAAMHQETFRTTRELAMAASGPRRLDLVVDNTVRAAGRALSAPHATKRVKYRVRLENDDPAKVFFSGRLQEVVPLDPHTAEITVHQLKPAAMAQAGAAAAPAPTPAPQAPGDEGTSASPKLRRPPNDEDRLPNNLIQSDDPRIVALAQGVADGETDNWKLALALEAFVKKTITLKNFSQAFSTAAEVAEFREGDCTEHAVLLAALARARGIPARVAIGLVYQAPTQSFAYHMWNELWIGDRWLPLDATLGRGGIGAGHLKLTDSSLAGATAYSSFLPVGQVIGQLKIEVLEAE